MRDLSKTSSLNYANPDTGNFSPSKLPTPQKASQPPSMWHNLLFINGLYDKTIEQQTLLAKFQKLAG